MFVWMDGMLCKVIAFFGLDKIFLPSSWNILKLKLSLSFPLCLLYCRISLYMINKFDNNISSPEDLSLKVTEVICFNSGIVGDQAGRGRAFVKHGTFLTTHNSKVPML